VPQAGSRDLFARPGSETSAQAHDRRATRLASSRTVVETGSIKKGTPTQRRAYVLADNKLALNAGWDLEMVSPEIGELGEAGFDLSLTGFDKFELGELFAGEDPRSDRSRRCAGASRAGPKRSRGGVCRLHYPRRLFGADARRPRSANLASPTRF
jgi:hypothetical protein